MKSHSGLKVAELVGAGSGRAVIGGQSSLHGVRVAAVGQVLHALQATCKKDMLFRNPRPSDGLVKLPAQVPSICETEEREYAGADANHEPAIQLGNDPAKKHPEYNDDDGQEHK